MESKIVRRVQQVMNILPSFSPYPSSSLPLTTTDTKGSAWDNEQKKSKIMVAEGSRMIAGEVVRVIDRQKSRAEGHRRFSRREAGLGQVIDYKSRGRR